MLALLLEESIPASRDQIEMEMRQLRGEIDLREVRFSRLAAALADRGRTEDEGDLDAVDAIRFDCGMTSNAVQDRIAVGRKLDVMPESEQAFYNGEIGFAHLIVMARTAKAVGKAFNESDLLEKARKNTPGKFHHICMRYRHAADPKKYAEEQADQAENRYLSLIPVEDGGLLLNGWLDPVGGAAVRSALEPLARKSGAHDDRPREKRLADAFVDLATKGTTVQMQVTSSVETLLGLVGAQGAESEFSLPISFKTVERWACDCSLSRVLLQDSVVIDVGRSERTIKGPRRRALIARDQHCQWRGCERPASWCDGHHLKHWLHGGSGEIENQVLLCGRHHWLVHEGNWQLVKTAEGDLLPVAPLLTFGRPREPH